MEWKKTIIGIIILLIPVLNAVFDLNLSALEFQELFAQVAVLVWTILAIYWRIVAKWPLSLK